LGNDIGPALVAINPASDIVLDVARAADPEKYRAAVDRLTRLRAASPGDEVLMPPAEFQTPAAPASAPAATVSGPAYSGPAGERRPQLDAYGKFEAFVLQSFLESMLPKNATAVFGKGSAGEFWRSMLAEKLGTELARSGQVGIAQRLTQGASHASQPPASGNAAPPMAPAEPNERGASAPSVNQRS
jgi:peptidoglycan hydrolase FlgJ